MKHQLPLVIGFVSISLQPIASLAQVPPAPAVEWRSVAWLDSKPNYGTLHTLTGIDHDPIELQNIR